MSTVTHFIDIDPAGAGIGEIVNAVHGLNTGIPQLQNRLKGPKWLPFIVGLPPLLLFSGASVAFGGAHVTRLTLLFPSLQVTVQL
ncbi:uncharacterized protein LOC122277671 isoform X3 [Carya illinoinensis]|uniref:uncharacterized protein LOC122277671 isoform X3 n=1 Tax=Carya illinoinensis TaxID=32201 RepID=UPI001C726B21|nr:uncharacterized protein LOC122277671 isoform X3 [Carya illinoinensis]XP_042943696.1 uncharacterized protein LOC122277671 isoform X3 [Carya illinoinensis]